MTNADILKKKLRADVAAASGPAPKRLGRGALAELNRWNAARARLAALPGPALLEIVIDLVGPLDEQEQDDFFDADRAQRIRKAIAEAASALEVS